MNDVCDRELDGCDLRHWPTGLIIGGLGSLAIGAVISPERVWGNLLLIAYLLAGFGLGGCFFLAFCGVTGARWSRSLTPLARDLAATLPWTGLVVCAVAMAGSLFYYPWAHGAAAHGASYWFKNAWLSPGFFVGRTAVYGMLWAVVGRWMSVSPAPGAARSAVTLVLLAVSTSLAGFDWVMSLEPLWFSTMFGVYQFAGIFLGGLAGLVLLTAWRKRSRTGGADVDERQLHDLGKLLFGFSCFWMYIWFSQYMLIWYVNIPEEAVYFIRRTQGLWWPLMLLNVLLNWGLPFFTLLPRPAKRSWRMMVRISTVILIGRWVDLYLMVLPPLAGDRPVCGSSEMGGLLLGAGMMLLFLKGRPLHSESTIAETWHETAATS